MAFNCPLMCSRDPLSRDPVDQDTPEPLDQELFVLHRSGIQLTVQGSPSQPFGTLFLSTLRMVFVADQRGEHVEFDSFDVPLASIRREAFNQPVFGCNNLSGWVIPIPDGGLADFSQFSLIKMGFKGF